MNISPFQHSFEKNLATSCAGNQGSTTLANTQPICTNPIYQPNPGPSSWLAQFVPWNQQWFPLPPNVMLRVDAEDVEAKATKTAKSKRAAKAENPTTHPPPDRRTTGDPKSDECLCTFAAHTQRSMNSPNPLTSPRPRLYERIRSKSQGIRWMRRRWEKLGPRIRPNSQSIRSNMTGKLWACEHVSKLRSQCISRWVSFWRPVKTDLPPKISLWVLTPWHPHGIASSPNQRSEGAACHPETKC